MKKMMKKVVAPVVLAATMTLSGCFGGKSKDKTPKPTETYTFSNYDDTYYVGQTFSIVGTQLTISDVYGKTTTITVTEDMIVSLPNMAVPGEKTIIIKYNDKEYSFKINVLVPTSQFLVLEKLQALRDTYKNYSSTITFDSNTDISFGYLGESVSYEDLVASGVINDMLGSDELSSDVYDALLSALVEGSFNLKENDIIDTETLKAKFNSNGAVAKLLSELTGINYFSYIMNTVISEEEDEVNIAYVTSLIANSTAIISEEGYEALEVVVKGAYDSLKEGHLIDPVAIVNDIVNVVEEHTASSNVKAIISTLGNVNKDNARNIVSTFATEFYNNGLKIMTIDNFENHYNDETSPVFVDTVYSRTATAEYINATINRIKLYENLIFDVASIRSFEDAKEIISNVIKVNLDYSTTMKETYTLLKGSNWLLVLNDGSYYDTLHWGYFLNDEFVPDYDSDIETFTNNEERLTSLYEAVSDLGLVALANELGLIEGVLSKYGYEEYAQTVYDILNALEQDGEGAYQYIVDYLFTEENDYYINTISDYIIGFGSIEGAIGQQAIKEQITTYFTQIRNAEVIEARDLWVDVLGTINKYTTDDKVRSATESLESLEMDKIVHILSDLAYIDALNDTKVITAEQYLEWYDSYDGCDFDFVTTSVAQNLINKAALSAQAKYKLYEDTLLNFLNVRSYDDAKKLVLSTLESYKEAIALDLEILELSKENNLVVGSVDPEGDFYGDVWFEYDYDEEKYYVDYDWEIESLTSIHDEAEAILNSFVFGFDFLENPTAAMQSFASDYRDLIIEYAMEVAYGYGVEYGSDAETGVREVVTSSVDAFIAGKLTLEGLLEDISNAVETYASEETKTALNSIYTMIMALDYDPTLDYNEIFKDVPLPEGIDSIDYNRLMAKLYDSSTYDMVDFENVNVSYITDMGGNVTGAVITFDIVVDFDAVIAYIDGTVKARIVVDFK